MFRKTSISYPLIRTCTCAYQGVKNVSFSESFAYVLNGFPLNRYFWRNSFFKKVLDFKTLKVRRYRETITKNKGNNFRIVWYWLKNNDFIIISIFIHDFMYIHDFIYVMLMFLLKWNCFYVAIATLTYFMSMLPFFTPWKSHKSKNFLMLSGHSFLLLSVF